MPQEYTPVRWEWGAEVVGETEMNLLKKSQAEKYGQRAWELEDVGMRPTYAAKLAVAFSKLFITFGPSSHNIQMNYSFGSLLL